MVIDVRVENANTKQGRFRLSVINKKTFPYAFLSAHIYTIGPRIVPLILFRDSVSDYVEE